MASLCDLPTELQFEIISNLSNIDTRNVRLTCGQLYDNATPHLFRSILVCPRKRALYALHHISVRPNLADCVKEIVFDGALYCSSSACNQEFFTSEVLYASQLIAQEEPSWIPNSYKWRQYQTLHGEQLSVQAIEVLLPILITALKRFPKVSSVVYSSHSRSVPFETTNQPEYRIAPRSTLLPTMPHRMRYMSTARDATPEHPFRQLIVALYESQCAHIREFKVETFPFSIPHTNFSLDLVVLPELLDQRAYQYFFQHLTKLEFSMTIPFFRWELGVEEPPVQDDVKRVANLAFLIDSAKKLQYVSIEINNWNDRARTWDKLWSSHAQTTFDSIGMNATWESLKSLRLIGVGGTEEEFSHIISRHEKTLEAISFENCNFNDGLWANIVDRVVATSSILPFTLVDCLDRAIQVHWNGRLPGIESETLHCNGHLEVDASGDREFIEGNHQTKSVYEIRRLVSEAPLIAPDFDRSHGVG